MDYRHKKPSDLTKLSAETIRISNIKSIIKLLLPFVEDAIDKQYRK
jgi:hypothetical protein